VLWPPAVLPPACPAPALPAAPPAWATAQALHIKTVPAKTNIFFFISLSPPWFKLPHSHVGWRPHNWRCPTIAEIKRLFLQTVTMRVGAFHA
jgi:hypothetical protein